MDEGNILRIDKRTWKIPLRLTSLLAFFVGACSLVQCVLMLMKYYEQQNLSMLVVFIFLLITPLTFTASLFFAFGVHRICAGIGSDRQIVLGFAMMILASVDNLIYISIHRSSDSLSFYLLGGIQIICYVICFLYYQNLGTFSLTLCASILLAACALLELEEAVRYIVSIELIELADLYYLAKNVLNTLIAALALMFVFGFAKGIRTKD
jgi:hypothetical protein